MTNAIVTITKQLKNYNFIKKIIEKDLASLQELTYIKGVNYDQVKTQATNKINNGIENMLLAKESIEERLAKNTRTVRDIEAALEILEIEEYNIINGYYIEEHPWDIVAYKNNISVRQCQRKRDKSLAKISIFLFGENAV